jgi:hypothetical protein
MPTPTPEVLQGKVEALKKKLAEKGESLEGPELRALKKKIRRVQRRRRLMLEGLAKVAPAKTAETAAGKPAEKAGEPVEDKKEE